MPGADEEAAAAVWWLRERYEGEGGEVRRDFDGGRRSGGDLSEFERIDLADMGRSGAAPVQRRSFAGRLRRGAVVGRSPSKLRIFNKPRPYGCR
jgi:hypothetical protein